MVDLNLKLPDSYFLEEERDGYLVSSKIKELWAIQLDLLCEFDRVCNKYNLKYILDFGSLLGAVRHKGFIPWDDDLDVSMLREDYDKLMDVGPNEFSHPYFLQSFFTDKNYDCSVAKLRRSDTTFLMTENTKHRTKYNQGIFIDIFVFDYIPTNDKAFVSQVNLESYNAYLHMYALLHRPSLHYGLKLPFVLARYLFYRFRYGNAKKEYKRLESICRRYEPSDYVANIMYLASRCRPRIWHDEIMKMPFEGFLFPVPMNYDAVLRNCYGDYMIPVHGTSAHTVVCFDTDRPYYEVLKEKKIK